MNVIGKQNFPILSIIIPVYNVEKYVERCIRSVEEQDLSQDNYEVIIVNDGSTDRSVFIVDQLAYLFSNIIVINKKNGGLSSARNAGLNVAKGHYVMFVDSDDYLLPRVIGSLVNRSYKDDLEIYSFQLRVYYSDGSFIDDHVCFDSSKIYCGEEALIKGLNIGSVCKAFYKRDFIEKYNLRFTDGISHEDVDFNSRAYAFAHRMAFTNVVAYVYCWNDQSINRDISYEKRKKGLLDNILVASNILLLTHMEMFPVGLISLYRKLSNSIVISNFLQILFIYRNLNLFREFMISAMKHNMLPIKGRTLSWKTTLLIPKLNLLYFIFRKFAKHNQIV